MRKLRKMRGKLRMKTRARRKTSRKNSRRSTVKRAETRRKTLGGGANIPGTILSPYEQSKLFLYPQYDDMRYNNDFLDSRTPLLNTANKIFVAENVNNRLQSRY